MIAPSSQARAEAEEALRLARVDPAAVRAMAAASTWAPLHADEETRLIAEMALGLASKELHDLANAHAHLERARTIAGASGLAVWLVETDIELAAVLARGGQLEKALEHLHRCASSVPTASMAARVECQRALVFQRLGRLDDAIRAYRRGLASMRRAGDRLGEARVLINRGLVHAYGGRFDAAEADVRRSARLYRELGRDLEAAYAEHNLGFVAARRGDIPAALQAYERAARAMAALDVAHPAALLDYADTLLRANLIVEARDAGRQAVAQLEEAGMGTDLAEARLLLAEIALASGDLDEAEHLAVLAQEAFLSQGRTPWEIMARYLWLRVRWERGDRTEQTMQAARRLAFDLRAAGWASSSTHARILAARMALERGQTAVAESELRIEARRRRRAPVEVRIQAWHAEALLRWQRGDAPGAQSALRAGMRTVSRYRASLGATELRVNAGTHAYELGRLALHIAVRCDEPERVLAWAERSRASTMQLRPVRPPADDDLAARLAELRSLESRIDELACAGQDNSPLLRRKASLEDAIRQKTWHAPGPTDDEPDRPPLKELRRALGSRVLVEFVESDELLYAVTVRDGRSRLDCLAPLADIERELDGLRFALNRLTSGRGAEGTQVAMRQAFTKAADRLDSLLFGTLRTTIGDRPVVIVPTGTLHLLPWSALPSCRGRAVAVAPSATVWLRAMARSASRDGATVLAAGPGVPHGGEEIRQLSRIYPDAKRLDGRAATAKSLAKALDGARLAHVVAHGSFRADNPLFSSLRMIDGPLTVYELERLSRAPERVVLSACNAGLSAVRPDNELLGLSSALFALGTATLVASVLLVGDRETGRLMVDFHQRLAGGRDAPTALAEAQEASVSDDPAVFASASSFVCLGA